MSYDLVMEGRVLTDSGIVQSYLCIKDGLISDISRTPPGHGSMVRSHHRCLLLPGCIDSHVHFRDPGMTHKEDLASGSLSAAFGGVTSVIDMPNTKPPTLDPKSFLEKHLMAKERSYVDFGLYLGVTPLSRPEATLEKLSRTRGSPFPMGLKAFLGESTGAFVFKPIEGITGAVEAAKLHGSVLSLHAEDGDLIHPKNGGDEGDRGVLSRHLTSRPAEVEVSAIDRALNAAGPNAGTLHFLHVSSREGIERTKGSGASTEVTPHHLMLDMKWCEANLEIEALAKVNPPIRTTRDKAALWEALISGNVTVVGSDHAPHMLAEKGDGDASPSGMPGTETMLPLLLHEFRARKLDLRVLQKVLCEGPAARFGIERKGSLGRNRWADIVVLDLDDVTKVRSEDLHSKCGWTPYEGFRAVFPKAVYSRGELLVEDGNICCHPGRGYGLSISG